MNQPIAHIEENDNNQPDTGLIRRVQAERITDEWTVVPQKDFKQDLWSVAASKKAKRITILGEIIGQDQDGALHYGPMYFDIDNENLDISLRQGRDLIEKLLSQDIHPSDLEIHLSGGKGLHVFIQPEVLGITKPTKDLHIVYQKLSDYFYCSSKDDQVYSAKKGRMFWIPDVFRADKQVYKRRVSIEELTLLNKESYLETVATEPDLTRKWPTPKRQASIKLKVIIESLREQIKTNRDEEKNSSYSDKDKEDAKNLFGIGSVVPDCVQKITQLEGGSYNLKKIQLLGWLAKSSATREGKKSVIDMAVQHWHSDRHGTRESMTAELGSYVSTTLEFSCAGMGSVKGLKPECDSCPVKAKEGQESIGLMGSMLLHQNMGQYFKDSEFTIPVTSFTMNVESQILDEFTGRVDSCNISMRVPGAPKPVIIPDFNEVAWTSKSAFKQEIKGIAGAIFLGTDDDVSKLKLTVSKESLFGGVPVDKVIKTMKVGVQYRRRKGPDDVRNPASRGLMVYVEPDFSLTSTGRAHSHTLVNKVDAAPSIRYKDLALNMDDHANHCFKLLCSINRKHIIATVLGWYFASHLKAHCHKLFGRFPLMCISGVAGTGKNATVAAFQRLSGLEGGVAKLTLEAPNSTKLPFQQALSNSTTIPRIINELNRKSMSNPHYAMLVEMLKASFDFQVISKGRLGGGDRSGADISTMEWTITSPVVTLSEEPIKITAVSHRAISVELDPLGNAERTNEFVELEPDMDKLSDIGCALTDMSLHTTMSQVDKLMDNIKLPDEVENSMLPDRLKFGHSVVIMAYDWALERLEDKGMNQENMETIRELKQEFVSYLTENITRISAESSINEVDKVLRDFAIMAHNEDDTRSHHTLEFGRHYVVVDGVLILDSLVSYPLMSRFKTSSPEGLSIKTHDAFLTACRAMPYFLAEDAVNEYLPTNGRGVMELSIKGMKEANIPVEMFRQAGQ